VFGGDMFKKMSLDWIKIGSFLLAVTLMTIFLLKEQLTLPHYLHKPDTFPKKTVSHIETDDSVASMVIKGKLGEIQKCYDAQLERGLNKSGKLVLQWYVNADGFASNFTEQLNELGSAELYNCSIQAIEHWNFPKQRPTYIRHTFNLKEAPRKTAYIIEGAESVTVGH
jgi:flavin-dependent dehydrogenase